MATTRRSRLSLRAFSRASVVFFCLLVFGDTVALVATSSVLRRSAQAVERDSRAVDTTQEVDRTLREYHRLGNLWISTQEPELQTARGELRSGLRETLGQLESYAGSATERRLLRQLKDQVTTYLAAREAAEAGGLSLDQAVHTLRPPFERALTSNALLRHENEADRQRSRATAERAFRTQRLVAIASGLLLVLAVAVVTAGVYRHVLLPILDLQDAVRRFQTGDAAVKPSGGALTEICDLADRFNEMTSAIATQRSDQLTFLAAVAHDLRNPLSGLKLIVQSLERTPGAATPDRFRRLDRQLDRLTRMVGDLLDATRIESGHLELQLEDFDLREVAQAMIDLYAPTTSTHEVSLNAPTRRVVVRGDPLRIEQVISNLVSNAIKYSPAGGPVEVSISATDGEAVLSVSDRGVGIPSEELPDLFRAFRRRPSTAGLTPGVGLGLSIVRRIVQAHGGRIDVESTPNVGSTIRVRLPLVASRSRDADTWRPESGREPAPPEPR